MAIIVGDDVALSPLPGALHPVKTHLVSGEEYQEIVFGGIDKPWDKIEIDEPGGVLTEVRAYHSGNLVRTLTISTVGDTTTIEKS